MANKKEKILIVDDDQYIRELYEEVLSAEGYDITSAENGNQCIEKLQNSSFDLILLDVMMPKLDGIGVLTKMRDNKLFSKQGKVIVLTNLAHGPVIDEATKLGAKGFLIKADLTPDQLTQKIRELLK